MNKSGSSISPRIGTYLLGTVNTVTSAMSIFFVKTFKRKSLLSFGHIMIAVSHILTGFFKI